MTQPTADPMLTVGEVCAQLGIGRTKFYSLVNSGEIEAINVNPASRRKRFTVGQRGAPRPSIRVPQSQVDAFKDRNRHTAVTT